MIQVIEKFDQYGHPWHEYGEIDDERLRQYKPGIRVLPAAYFHQPGTYFEFIRRHEPGTKHWPKGGIECYDAYQGVRCFFLDQVIVHPAVINRTSMVTNGGKRGRPKKSTNQIQEVVVKTGKRGRKPLDPEEKARRAKEREYVPKGYGKRGRPSLSEEERVAREAAKSAKPKFGKRGRPPKNAVPSNEQ